MDNKKVVKDFYEIVVSQNLLEQVKEYVSEECLVRTGEQSILIGVEGMKHHLLDVKKTYPDYTMRIIRQYCDGDYVISEFVMEGTHEGEWLGMKPTNKRLSFTGVNIDKMVKGKMVEHGGAVNTFDTLFAEKIIKPA